MVSLLLDPGIGIEYGHLDHHVIATWVPRVRSPVDPLTYTLALRERESMADPRLGSVGIIGAGASGLITAHILLQDGFKDVQLLTRDKSPGGVWATERVYPGLALNNVHGEFSFSSMPMPPPANSAATGGRLGGDDMRAYMEAFADKFLKGRIRFETEVEKIRRNSSGSGWIISVLNKQSGSPDTLEFARLVLCTGGCSTPNIPARLSAAAAKQAGFRGPVVHSSQLGGHFDDVIASLSAGGSTGESGGAVVVGGGKLAQDIAAFLATSGYKVTVVFEATDAFLAASSPLPDFIRKSRFLSILSPHCDLHTRLERFLHTTWLGSKIVHFVWDTMASTSFTALKVPEDSPLRRTYSVFWGVRTNDLGVGQPNGFHALVNANKIKVVAPARVEDFGEDGRSLIIDDGRCFEADAVILATGFSSSWSALFNPDTMDELGLGRHPPRAQDISTDEWHYASMASPPPAHPDSTQWASSIYRGLVPAKNITHRDFAINGAVLTTNNGYVFEVTAHWISSYFLGDKMFLPSSTEEALITTERNAAWMRKRFPDILLWVNESYSSDIPFWTWPQFVDQLLEDMGLQSMRSGGNWLTWPFKVIDLQEIATLGEERSAKRG